MGTGWGWGQIIILVSVKLSPVGERHSKPCSLYVMVRAVTEQDKVMGDNMG